MTILPDRTIDALRRRLGLSRRSRDAEAFEDALRAVNALGAEMSNASDEALRQLAESLRSQVRAGLSLDEAAVPVFALVREVAARTIGLRPYDVQLLGGLALHAGAVVQMSTGEGKTLAAVAPVSLHALTGCGAHVLTFNDYLARRDADWMGPIYRFLGLSVAYVQEGMPAAARRAAYAADVTYATAKEAGFDLLRDGLVVEPRDLVHRPLHMAVIDEADSILIDEARIPLVIAGITHEESIEPEHLAAIVRQLAPDQHYLVDREAQAAYLTDEGIDRVETLLDCGNLYAPKNLALLTELNAALYAATLLRRDVDYIVRRGQIEIVDEFTGRVVEDRHWPDGLQAAIEAKEGLNRSAEGRVLGQITMQHFVQQYQHLCGMTATAQAAADELFAVYGLPVLAVPPNRPCVRVDHPDVVFTRRDAKQRAVIAKVRHAHEQGRPILVGTLTVAESEALAAELAEAGIPCQILNAKRDDQEARIVAEAGKLSAVTISTNMAGRGTDIRLGGSDGAQEDQVSALGGLYVLGTNRHESQRVDDQLRGRAGRQGDPGTTCFFVSLEDELLQQSSVRELIPAGYRPRDQWAPIDNPMVQRQIARAQRLVEGRNTDIRQGLRAYSQIIEHQRRIVHEERQRILLGNDPPSTLRDRLPKQVAHVGDLIGSAAMADLERRLWLATIDSCWADHLATAAEIRDEIHLVAIGGLSPLEEFQRRVAHSFDEMRHGVEDRLVERFQNLVITKEEIDWGVMGLRGPSSTWTYLVHEDISADPIAATLISRRQIGFAVGAAMTGPLLMLWAVLARFRRRRA
jgi:preprotein translocase subunit SecA